MGSVALFVSPRGVRALLALLVLFVVVGPFESAGAAGSPAAGSPANVDAARIVQADHDPGNWMTYGRTYSEQRFSPLSQISADNAKQLGLAWYADLDTNRGQEATPLVIDGVLYVSTAWSMVKAYDAKTGRRLWSYDPAVPRVLGVRGCCDVVNRGVAAWQGKIFVGAFDGRLIALDARTGTPVWSVMTVDPSKPYTITMAPRVVKGRVVIGNSGNEYGVRGYVSAYDADTGKLVWRFYTVPGDPSKPFENDAMAMAAKTWQGEWWKWGGGGAPWEAMSYDPNLNLIYLGTGNGLEWNQGYRSASQGDNLFLSSIVAINRHLAAHAARGHSASAAGIHHAVVAAVVGPILASSHPVVAPDDAAGPHRARDETTRFICADCARGADCPRRLDEQQLCSSGLPGLSDLPRSVVARRRLPRGI
jgi:quinohemoprotein ethanol dehydrogenase